MSRTFWWPILIISAALIVTLAAVMNMTSPLRPVITFIFLLVCPGLAFVQLLNLTERLTEVTLGVALSLALAAVVAQTMVLAQIWAAQRGLYILIGLSFVGAGLQLIQVYRHNIGLGQRLQSKDGRIFAASFIGISIGTFLLGLLVGFAKEPQTPVVGLVHITPTQASQTIEALPSGRQTSTSSQRPTPTHPPTSAPTVWPRRTSTFTQTPTPDQTPTPTELSVTVKPSPTATKSLTPTKTISPTPTGTAIPSHSVSSRPKASWLVYVQSNLQTHNLVIVRPDGLVESLHDHAAAPAFSPDGSTIAFFGEEGISLLGGPYSQGNGIWLVDLQGGSPRRLVAIDHVKNIAWSPDNSKLAFEVVEPGGFNGIQIVDAVGGLEISRLPGGQPAWSPDSQQLALKACLPECGLWQMNFDGSEATSLTSYGTDSYPSWSPTGQFLVFSSDREGDWEIYRLRLADNDLQRLTNRPATDITPVFGPDGQEIFFRTDDQGSWRVNVITLDGAQERMLREGVGTSNDWGLARPAVR